MPIWRNEYSPPSVPVDAWEAIQDAIASASERRRSSAFPAVKTDQMVTRSCPPAAGPRAESIGS